MMPQPHRPPTTLARTRNAHAVCFLLLAGFAELALSSCGNDEILFPAPIAHPGQQGTGGGGGGAADAGDGGDAGDPNVQVVTCPDGGGLMTATFPGRPLSELARVVVLTAWAPQFPPYNDPGSSYKSYNTNISARILDAEAGVLLVGSCTANSADSVIVILPPRGH